LGVPEQPTKPARFGCQRGHARHGSPAAPLRPLPQAGKGRGAAGKACARMAATPCPLAAACGQRASARSRPHHKARGGQPGAAPDVPRRHARPAQPASPARGLYVIPARAGLHTATAAPAGRAVPACRRGTSAARPADPCRGGETPPRDPPPPQRPATGAAPSVRGHARRATSHPRPLRPGASAPGRGRRRPGLARMAASAWGRAAGLRGLAFSLTHRPAQSRRQGAPGRPRVRSRAPKELAARFECRAGARSPKHRGAAPAPQGLCPSTPARGSPLDPTEGAPIGAPSDRCGSPPKRAAGLSEEKRPAGTGSINPAARRKRPAQARRGLTLPAPAGSGSKSLKCALPRQAAAPVPLKRPPYLHCNS